MYVVYKLESTCKKFATLFYDLALAEYYRLKYSLLSFIYSVFAAS